MKYVDSLSFKSSSINNSTEIDNRLYIGDNLDALNLLMIEYREKIDVIYIDPPYGASGAGSIARTNYTNFLTRSSLVDLLRPRLEVARELLSDNGVLFCSMDDKNQAYIRVLLDEIFGSENYITTFAVINSNTGTDMLGDKIKTLGANNSMFRSSVEYVLCVRKSKAFKFALREVEGKKYIESRLTKAGNKISDRVFPAGTRIVGVQNKVFYGSLGGKSERIEILGSGVMSFKGGYLEETVVLRSCFSSPFMVEKYFNGESVVDNRGQEIEEVYFSSTGVPQMRKRAKGEVVTNVLSGYGDTSKSKMYLDSIMGKTVFSYPKHIDMMKDIISLHSNKKAVVLDFFAGSGTTGEAVLSLNRQDGGNRQFILCTNNQTTKENPNGIAYDVTTKRLKRVMTGSCYDGSNDFKWLEKNKPYGGSLNVFEIF